MPRGEPTRTVRLPCWLLDDLGERAQRVGVTLPLYLRAQLAPESSGHGVRVGVLPPCTPPRRLLRSTSWDGPAPSPGAVVLDGDDVLRIVDVAQGPGLGQYRLTVEPVDVVRWQAAS